MRRLALLTGLLAAQFVAGSEPRLVVPTGHPIAVTTLAVAPNGQAVVTGGGQHAILWSKQGHQLFRLGGLQRVNRVRISPDGKFGLMAGMPSAQDGNSIQIFEIETGRIVHSVRATSDVAGVDFLIATSGEWRIAFVALSNTVHIVDAKSNRDLVDPDRAIAYQWIERQGNGFIAASSDRLRRWLPGDPKPSAEALFPDGIRDIAVDAIGDIAVAGRRGVTYLNADLTYRETIDNSPSWGSVAYGDSVIWSTSTGIFRWGAGANTPVQIRQGRGLVASRGPHVAVHAGDSLTFGTNTFSMRPKLAAIEQMALSADGLTLWTVSSGHGGASPGRLARWSMSAGRPEISELAGSGYRSLAMTEEGALTVDGAGWVRLAGNALTGLSRVEGAASRGNRFAAWTRENLHLGRTTAHSNWIELPLKEIQAVTYVRDDRLAVLLDTGQGRVLDADSGREIFRFAAPDARAMTCDGSTLFAGGFGSPIYRFRVDTGAALPTLQVPTDRTRSLAVSSDIGQLAIGDAAGGLHLVDLGSGKSTTVETRLGRILSVGYGSQGRWLATLHEDGTLRFWQSDTGAELALAAMLPNDDWAVTDPAGRYDSGGSGGELYWLLGDQALELHQLRDSFYDPGLLAKHVALRGDAPRQTPRLAGLELPPRVEIHNNENGAEIVISAVQGEVGRIEMLWDNTVLETREGEGREVRINLDFNKEPYASRRSPTGNRLGVRAYSRDNELRSRAVTATASSSTPAALDSRFYGLFIGANYSGELRLNYAERDAERMADAMKLAASTVYSDRVFIQVLTPNRDGPARRDAIHAALSKIRTEARSHDVVLVFFAGHGMLEPWGERRYRYITAEATELPSKARANLFSMTDTELQSYFEGSDAVRARNKAVVLDTCAAGGFSDPNRRFAESDVQRALADLQDRGGLTVLSGCAADRAGYEDSRVQHGLLTYALLERLGQGNFTDDFVSSDAWFRESERRVGTLIDELDSRISQRPRIHGDRERTSFPIGIQSAIRSRLEVTPIRPLLVLGNIVDSSSPNLDDTLDLYGRLSTAMTAVRGSGLRLAPSRSSKAIKLNLSYRKDGKELIVSGFLALPDGGKFELRLSATDLDGVVAAVMDEVGKRVTKYWQTRKTS